MSANSKIEWCHHTFNPWIGCTKVSPGCANCYAEREDTRRKWTDAGWGKGNPRKRTSVANWRNPILWDKAAGQAGERHRVFCASLADVFDPEVPIEWLIDLLVLIDRCKNLDWLLLTKRPEHLHLRMDEAMNGFFEPGETFLEYMPNVWLGVSCEDQARALERTELLGVTRATVRFLSCEPLLGPINFDEIGMAPTFDWVICGGESGPGARLFKAEWAREIRDWCESLGIPFFLKQAGENHEGFGYLKAKKGNEIEEWPEGLRIREFPEEGGAA